MRQRIALIAAAALAAATLITLAVTTPVITDVIDFYRALTSTTLGWAVDLWNGVHNTIASAVHVYDAPGNAGVQIAGIGGYEWRGTPGLFVCDGQC